MRQRHVIPAVRSALGLSLGILATIFSPPARATDTIGSLYAFEEPLVPTAATTPGDDADLAAAISQYRARAAVDDTAPLNAFAASHPHSAWRLAVLTNIGLSDYHYGYFSRAIADFQAAWDAGRNATEPRAHALADRAAGELLRMHARLGHVTELTALLAEMKDRGLTGSATEMRTGAQEGLWVMRNQPGMAYLCGPMALKNLLLAGGATPASVAFLDSYRSSAHGVTLAEVSRLADVARLDHVLVHRTNAGEPIPVPSIVHWKVNHYAAIVGVQGDRFEMRDPTFGDSLWITRQALEAESSGYFLVPKTTLARTQAPAAYKPVGADEATRVYGMGTTNDSDHHKVTKKSPKTKKCGGGGGGSGGSGIGALGGISFGAQRGLCDYNFTEMLVSLDLTDQPVGYVPPKGPAVQMQITYNQREEDQPANFSFFNVSPKWTLNFLSYVVDDPTQPGANLLHYEAGGGAADGVGYNAATKSFAPDVQDQSVLSIAGAAAYKRTMPDGSSEMYATSNGATSYPRLLFLSTITDASGNALHLHYDGQFRLTAITDATGRNTTLSYGLTSSPLLVTKITDPFGRSASLTYDGMGRLVKIVDVIGYASQFTYDSSSLVDSLITPYGTTKFAYGGGTSTDNSRFLAATDPLGRTERLEYLQGANTPFSDPTSLVPSGIPSPFNAYLNARDTYYWDQHAYAVAAGDYSKARQRHWDHLNTNTGVTSDTLESVKYPLENRIWFAHPGQVGNSLGAGASGTDEAPTAIARVLDDGTTQLTQIAYNATGNISETTDPAGRQTQMLYAGNNTDVLTVQQKTATGMAAVAKFTYNAQHLPLTYIDAAGQKTTYTYNAAGQLLTSTNALGQKTSYTYNALGYLLSVINPNNKAVRTLAYDNFGRVASSTDSEGHVVKFAYDALDRVTAETYPDNTTRTFTYKTLDLVATKDRQGRVTSYTYDAGRNLIAVKNPAGDITRMAYYENGTLASITDANNHTTTYNVDIESRVTSKMYPDGHGTAFGYEAASGRLLYTADMMNQIKQYSYAPDDEISAINYYNSVRQTPNVYFSYDPYFPRLASMSDQSGTTQYQYYPPGVAGALHLMQETPPFANATIAYAYDALGRINARSVGGNVESFAYDALGRLITHKDDLGTFTRTYLGQTDELTGQTSGALKTVWSYDTNINDRRLTGISTAGGTTYGLKSSAEGDVSSQSDSTNKLTLAYAYDGDDHLLSVTPSIGGKYAYGYDAAGNLNAVTRPKGTSTIVSNSVNQVASVNGVAFTYDANGNLLRDYARTYLWDADNRLIAVSINGQAGMVTSFKYDGLGRRIAIDTTSGGTTTEARYQWCGETLCQARAANDTITRRYFIEGENAIATGQAYFYGLDQVGSVRDALLATTGAVAAHYDYEPYGAQSNATATATTDFKFAGLIYNKQTGLYLGTYRDYDPVTGRWISREQIDESDSPNLYSYADADPANNFDESGTQPQPVLAQLHHAGPFLRELDTNAEEYQHRERIPAVTKIKQHHVKPPVKHPAHHKPPHPKPPKKMRHDAKLPKPTKMCGGRGGPHAPNARSAPTVLANLGSSFNSDVTGLQDEPATLIDDSLGDDSEPPYPEEDNSPLGGED